MSVVGHWRRSALGAGGVALLLPLGLTLGVALTTALGGETTLRALGQLFDGPSTPSGFDDRSLDSPGDLPAIPVRTRPLAVRHGPGAVPSRPSATTTPTARIPVRTPSRPAPATPAKPKPTSSTTSSPATTPAPPAPPPPADAPSGSAVHEAAQGASDAASGVPVAGGPTGGAMQTVVDLIP